jgi:hypothetical protein
MDASRNGARTMTKITTQLEIAAERARAEWAALAREAHRVHDEASFAATMRGERGMTAGLAASQRERAAAKRAWDKWEDALAALSATR